MTHHLHLPLSIARALAYSVPVLLLFHPFSFPRVIA